MQTEEYHQVTTMFHSNSDDVGCLAPDWALREHFKAYPNDMYSQDGISDYDNPPDPVDEILPGFEAGTLGVLAAPGATDMSYFAHQLAIEVASPGGTPMNLPVDTHGPVIYIAADDNKRQINRRNHHILQKLRDREAAAAVNANLYFVYAGGCGFDIFEQMKKGGMLELLAQALRARLIVIDTLSRVHPRAENSNQEMGTVMSLMEDFAARTGVAILCLHHVSKNAVYAGTAKTAQAARGASVVVDNARWVGYLTSLSQSEAKRFKRPEPMDMREKKIKHWWKLYLLFDTSKVFGTSKENYDPSAADLWLRREKNGVLLLYGTLAASSHKTTETAVESVTETQTNTQGRTTSGRRKKV